MTKRFQTDHATKKAKSSGAQTGYLGGATGKIKQRATGLIAASKTSAVIGA